MVVGNIDVVGWRGVEKGVVDCLVVVEVVVVGAKLVVADLPAALLVVVNFGSSLPIPFDMASSVISIPFDDERRA